MITDKGSYGDGELGIPGWQYFLSRGENIIWAVDGRKHAKI